ncbi:hypothetical protein Btru_045473 [Bulinus truncatus]|nr:hypothetical protein Btru_045473 [Bulinus truncatus]
MFQGLLLLKFIFIIFVFFFAFAVTSQSLLYPNSEINESMMLHIVKRPSWAIFGEFLMDELKGDECNNSSDTNKSITGNYCPKDFGATVMFLIQGLYVIVEVILLLNILIAVFTARRWLSFPTPLGKTVVVIPYIFGQDGGSHSLQHRARRWLSFPTPLGKAVVLIPYNIGQDGNCHSLHLWAMRWFSFPTPLGKAVVLIPYTFGQGGGSHVLHLWARRWFSFLTT